MIIDGQKYILHKVEEAETKEPPKIDLIEVEESQPVVIERQVVVVEKRQKYRRMDWKPAEKKCDRYTIAIHPFTLVNNGLKADFEYELKTPGRWLQFQVAGYIAPQRDGYRYYYHDYDNYDYYSRRTNPIAGFDYFNKLGGFSIGVGYKHMFTRNGWYFSPALKFSHFSIHFREMGMASFISDGMTFYEPRYVTKKAKYYKPTVSFNVGKHIAFSKHFFMDLYTGLGITYSFYNDNAIQTYYYSSGSSYDELRYSDGMSAIGYSGAQIVGGIRFGFLLRGKPWKPVD